MSEANLASFVKKVEADPALQARLIKLREAAPDEALAGTIQLSEEYGMPVTAEELHSLQMLDKKDKGEISEEELEGVSGGTGSFFGTLGNVAKVGVGLLNSIVNQP